MIPLCWWNWVFFFRLCQSVLDTGFLFFIWSNGISHLVCLVWMVKVFFHSPIPIFELACACTHAQHTHRHACTHVCYAYCLHEWRLESRCHKTLTGSKSDKSTQLAWSWGPHNIHHVHISGVSYSYGGLGFHRPGRVSRFLQYEVPQLPWRNTVGERTGFVSSPPGRVLPVVSMTRAPQWSWV